MKVIIVGAGEVGYHIASKLSRENKDVVLIDSNAERLKSIGESLDAHTITGSGASPSLLKRVGIEGADMIVAVTDSDETNLVSCLISSLLSTGTTRIARIRNQDFFQMDEIRSSGEALGISLVINPEIEVVKTILRLLDVPGAVDVVDFAEGKIRFLGLKIEKGSPLAGLSLKELKQNGAQVDILIAAIYRENSVIIPHGETRLAEGDLVYVPSRPESVSLVMAFFGLRHRPAKNIFIMGGGNVGRQLALALEKRGARLKIIDHSATVCQELSQVVSGRTIVLRGDGTDQDLLEEENVADADVFIALTNDEEENVLACLQAKRLGARQTITRINKFSYIPLITAIGLETVVSSRLSAISAILGHIRRGKVMSVAALKGEEAEAIEFEALPSSDVAGKRLADLKFPRQALVASIVRGGQVVIPQGQTVLMPGDRIIIFARREVISKVEKAFMVKLEYF